MVEITIVAIVLFAVICFIGETAAVRRTRRRRDEMKHVLGGRPQWWGKR